MTSLWFVAYSCPDTSTNFGEKCRMDAANARHGQGHDAVTGPRLSERDREILEFERQWWKYA
ncbi:MAG: DUF3263 domain-containing protein, partial [Nocardioides sp.]